MGSYLEKIGKDEPVRATNDSTIWTISLFVSMYLLRAKKAAQQIAVPRASSFRLDSEQA